MGCLKCGRPTQPHQVFCPECLKVMADNPVKPGTTVNLYRRDSGAQKTPAKKQLKPEERIEKLSRKVRRLSIALWAVTLVFVITAASLGYLLHRSRSSPAIGQNYNTVSTSSSEASSDGQ